MAHGARAKSKHLILILAREFASKLAMPMFVADAKGDVVFYNEEGCNGSTGRPSRAAAPWLQPLKTRARASSRIWHA